MNNSILEVQNSEAKTDFLLPILQQANLYLLDKFPILGERLTEREEFVLVDRSRYGNSRDFALEHHLFYQIYLRTLDILAQQNSVSREFEIAKLAAEKSGDFSDFVGLKQKIAMGYVPECFNAELFKRWIVPVRIPEKYDAFGNFQYVDVCEGRTVESLSPIYRYLRRLRTNTDSFAIRTCAGSCAIEVYRWDRFNRSLGALVSDFSVGDIFSQRFSANELSEIKKWIFGIYATGVRTFCFYKGESNNIIKLFYNNDYKPNESFGNFIDVKYSDTLNKNSIKSNIISNANPNEQVYDAENLKSNGLSNRAAIRSGSLVSKAEVDVISAMPASNDTCISLSEALRRFNSSEENRKKSTSLLSDINLLISFAISEFDDPIIFKWSNKQIEAFDKMLPNIPNRIGIPQPHNRTLSGRYRFAMDNGWEGLARLTEKRIQDGYHVAIHHFFDWLIGKGYFDRLRPTFEHLDDLNLVSTERDAFTEEEILQIFSLPLFSGSQDHKNFWMKGEYFIQNHIYWGYLISAFTGVRTGEIGRLEINDFFLEKGIRYLRIRGFDPEKGRVARKDVKKFKTGNSERMLPFHPIFEDLGFFDRLNRLQDIGCKVVFPEWEPYLKENGKQEWGRPLTKSWAYIKGKLKISRKNVSLYSTRHWYASIIDNLEISHAARKKVMGHKDKSDISALYGAKNRFVESDLKKLYNFSNPTIEQISEILLSAKYNSDTGKLQKTEYFEHQSNWSEYYKNQSQRDWPDFQGNSQKR